MEILSLPLSFFLLLSISLAQSQFYLVTSFTPSVDKNVLETDVKHSHSLSLSVLPCCLSFAPSVEKKMMDSKYIKRKHINKKLN